MSTLRRGGVDAGVTPLVCFALVHVVIFAGLFRGVYTMPYSGTGLYYDYAGRVLRGLLPYRDFVLEYPPLAVVFFTLPRVLGESFRWYYVWFQASVVVFDLVIVGTLYLAARWWTLPVWRLLAAYSVAVLAAGPIILQQYDIFPAAFALLAVVAFARGRFVGAGIFLGLGIMTKAYPVLLAPVFVLTDWKRNRRGLAMGAIACAATCLLILAPWLIVAPRSLGVFVAYHAARGIHLDSLYGSIALALHSLFLKRAELAFAFGSWSLAGPIPDTLARISSVVLGFTLCACYVAVYRAASRDADAARRVQFVAHASALVLAASLAVSKVLSPQYLIWLMAFIPLVAPARHRLALALYAFIGLLTYYIYPVRYEDLLGREDFAVLLLVVRNVSLIALAVVLARSLREASALPLRTVES